MRAAYCASSTWGTKQRSHVCRREAEASPPSSSRSSIVLGLAKAWVCGAALIAMGLRYIDSRVEDFAFEEADVYTIFSGRAVERPLLLAGELSLVIYFP